jgi:hypothetical protein
MSAISNLLDANARAEQELLVPALEAPRLQSLSEAHVDPQDHVHNYVQVPNGERTDRMRFVCRLYKCTSCPDWYWV